MKGLHKNNKKYMKLPSCIQLLYQKSADVFKFLFSSLFTYLGPVVQSIVNLMSSLMTNSLTVVAKVFSNTSIFLLQKCELQKLLAFFFSKKY